MWFVIGLLLGISLLLLLAFWLHDRKVNIAWYEWLIAVVGLALVVFSIQNYSATFEVERTAPSVFLLIFGLPGVLLLALAGALVWWGSVRKRKKEIPVSA